VNKCILIGRLTRDPEVRYTTPNNPEEEERCVARYTLAVDRGYKSQGAPEPGTDFISCVCFQKTAQFAEKFLKKGAKIAICGKIQTGSYTNKEGVKVYTTDVVVETQEFVEPKATPAPNNDDFLNGSAAEPGLPF
jgi:single-strand DNA-binding protein